jgi:signal transduction histidine kinase
LVAHLYRIRKHAWAGYLVAVIASVLAIAGHYVLTLAGGSNTPFLSFLLALVISTMAGGIGPGLLSVAVTAAFAFNLLAPLSPHGLPAHPHAVTATMVLLVGVIIVVLADYGMRAATKLDEASKELRLANERLEARVAERTAELVQAGEQLRQAQKMEAIGKLTGGIAHDFNNLLTGMSGSLDMLESYIAQGRYNELPRYVTTAKETTNRAATLTHRLLAFARRQPLTPRSTNINTLVAGMADLIARTISSSIELSVQPALALHATLVDPNQLEHALLNLCINGSDAMQAGGRLTIATHNVTLHAEAAAALDLPQGDYVTLSVADTGTGMPPEVLAHVFDPFFTTKPAGQGTGLGLSMVYGLTRQSGGNVAISSTPGRGTLVILYLPRHSGPVEPFASAPPPPGITGNGETILVVDDETSVRVLVTEVLQGAGYNILQAANGAAALELLHVRNDVVLLITDLGLPDISGHDLAATARSFSPGLKLLFLTGYAASTPPPNAPDAPMLTKPFALADVPPLVHRLLALQDIAPILGESASAL